MNNSRERRSISRNCASRSGESRGVGSLLLRSASSTKALADSPVSTGDELIVIAISYSVFALQIYDIVINYTRAWRLQVPVEFVAEDGGEVGRFLADEERAEGGTLYVHALSYGQGEALAVETQAEFARPTLYLQIEA